MIKNFSRKEWEAEGIKRFGTDKMDWRFVCPACGHVASVRDYYKAGAKESQTAFNCIGRYLKGTKGEFMKNKKQPCNYTGGGLFQLNPVSIDNSEDRLFDFSE